MYYTNIPTTMSLSYISLLQLIIIHILSHGGGFCDAGATAIGGGEREEICPFQDIPDEIKKYPTSQLVSFYNNDFV